MAMNCKVRLWDNTDGSDYHFNILTKLFDRAIKNCGIKQELKERRYFESESRQRRKQKRKAKLEQRKLLEQEGTLRIKKKK